MWLAKKYCVGSGVELGAGIHNAFGLECCINVAPSDGVSYLFPKDLEDYVQYQKEQIRGSGAVATVDMVGDFQSIKSCAEAFDYIISSHVIEHVPDLFSAYIEASRVLKSDGIFFCIFPKRTAAPTDRPRALTTLEQMIEDHNRGVTVLTSDFEDWRGHYQVFSLQSMIRAVNYINVSGLASFYIECVEETDSKVGNGHTIVLRKWEGMSGCRVTSSETFNSFFNELIREERLEEALSCVKVQLSYDFFDAKKLYLASALSRLIGASHEANEFLQQALVVDPENEVYRHEFLNTLGRPYVNPVL